MCLDFIHGEEIFKNGHLWSDRNVFYFLGRGDLVSINSGTKDGRDIFSFSGLRFVLVTVLRGYRTQDPHNKKISKVLWKM